MTVITDGEHTQQQQGGKGMSSTQDHNPSEVILTMGLGPDASRQAMAAFAEAWNIRGSAPASKSAPRTKGKRPTRKGTHRSFRKKMQMQFAEESWKRFGRNVARAFALGRPEFPSVEDGA
ncbi:MAG: hypothetical protein JSS89_13220 [Bacteroidetes bacterium]|nr:hypothetical protein [Bacteroidota bacterium]